MWLHGLVLALFVYTPTALVTRVSHAATVKQSNHDGDSKVGVDAVIKQQGVNKIVSTILPSLVKKVENLQIPDISGSKDSFDYKVTNIKVTSLTYSSAAIDLSKDIALTANGVNVHVTLDWSYREKVWPHLPNGGGSADATADGSSFTIGLTPTVDDNGHLQLALSQCAINLGSFDIKVHGSIFSWLYDILVDAFKGTLKNAIQSAIQTELGTLIKSVVNKILASYPFRYPVDKQTQVDFTFSSAPVVAQGVGRFGITGAFEPIATNTPPAIPHGADIRSVAGTNSALDLFIDEYLPNSAFYTYFKEGRLQGFVDDSMLPSAIPIRLNTSSWVDICPGVFKQYPNQAMRLFYSFAKSPSVLLVANDHSTFQGEATAVFSVSSNTSNVSAWHDVFTLGVGGLIGKVTVNFTDSATLTGKIGSVSFVLSEEASTVGAVDITDVNSLISTVLDGIVLPEINKYLTKGVSIPTIDGLKFILPSIAIDNGYLRVSTDISYNPPAPVLAVMA